MESAWLTEQNRMRMTPQRRCPHCNFSLKPSFNSCICSCKHEYSEQITQLLFQPTDNTFVGDVCKNCGDIKNERLVGKKTHTFGRYLQHLSNVYGTILHRIVYKEYYSCIICFSSICS